jgi:hypothetical protein
MLLFFVAKTIDSVFNSATLEFNRICAAEGALMFHSVKHSHSYLSQSCTTTWQKNVFQILFYLLSFVYFVIDFEINSEIEQWLLLFFLIYNIEKFAIMNLSGENYDLLSKRKFQFSSKKDNQKFPDFNKNLLDFLLVSNKDLLINSCFFYEELLVL